MDTAYKLSILSNLVFSLSSKISDIYIEGIANIEEIDIKMSDKIQTLKKDVKEESNSSISLQESIKRDNK